MDDHIKILENEIGIDLGAFRKMTKDLPDDAYIEIYDGEYDQNFDLCKIEVDKETNRITLY